MTEPSTTACLLFPDIFPKPVVAQFDQREGSSDGGAFLLKAVDRRYGLTDAGLVEAEFAQDDYVPAQRAFGNALRMNSNDRHSRERLQLNDQILALDPTLSGLSSAEQYHRSERLLQGSLTEMEQCVGSHGKPSAPDSIRELTDTAGKLLSSRRSPPLTVTLRRAMSR